MLDAGRWIAKPAMHEAEQVMRLGSRCAGNLSLREGPGAIEIAGLKCFNGLPELRFHAAAISGQGLASQPIGYDKPCAGAGKTSASLLSNWDYPRFVTKQSVAEAVRLLGGSIEEVFRGISLIDAAAAEGEPAALERRALFEAVGCCRAPNWDFALNSILEAAERGSAAARQQMLVLARGAADHPPDWGKLRAGLSLERLVEVPQKKLISESPRLRLIEKFATSAQCNWIIGRARDRLRPATVVNPAGGTTIETVRTNRAVEFQLADMDMVIEAIRSRISAATHLPLPLFEPTQVLHYAPGQHFEPHHDYFDPQNEAHAEEIRTSGQRIATFLVYLNDEYAGGETAFPSARLKFRGNVGDALFIANVERGGRPDPLTLHAGTAPISGEKWLLSQWIRDKPGHSAAEHAQGNQC